jgi:hypothetical protein
LSVEKVAVIMNRANVAILPLKSILGYLTTLIQSLPEY